MNEQAEDEGLWFIAQTAAEAYLQQPAVTAPVLPEPTGETVEAHLAQLHHGRPYMLGIAHALRVHGEDHDDPCSVTAFGHTHERSHDG